MMSYLGATVIEARLCSVTDGIKRFVPNNSQSNVFCRNPHDRRIRSDTSLISTDDELPDSIVELFLGLHSTIVFINLIYFQKHILFYEYLMLVAGASITCSSVSHGQTDTDTVASTDSGTSHGHTTDDAPISIVVSNVSTTFFDTSLKIRKKKKLILTIISMVEQPSLYQND